MFYNPAKVNNNIPQCKALGKLLLTFSLTLLVWNYYKHFTLAPCRTHPLPSLVILQNSPPTPLSGMKSYMPMIHSERGVVDSMCNSRLYRARHLYQSTFYRMKDSLRYAPCALPLAPCPLPFHQTLKISRLPET